MNEIFLKLFQKIDFDKIIDHPNILIAAAFWEDDRYQAARVCYKFLREIDDLIDCHKSEHTLIHSDDRKKFTENVESWIHMVRNQNALDEKHQVLIETVQRFHIPAWPMEAFAKSMVYDINHNGFKTIADFIEYSQGASVAPASIFVHLNGLIKAGEGFHLPPFNVKKVATPCAIFSYIVHIIRDFQKDQLNHLNYFADEEISRNGLTHDDLSCMAKGAPIKDGFRNMIQTYYDLATQYKQQTWDIIEEISPLLEPRYRLSLLIVFNLYLMVYERIDVKKGSFKATELNPTPEEIKERVYETMLRFENQ
jgi:phytoene/squalene synthetase